jgi:alanine-glyoxylate transaminase/serine-glyoxylate transaminase/serine-pyruvate transaminase
VPEGVSDARVRARLLEDFNIEIGAGLGPFKGRVWRIGLMGFGSTKETVLLVLESLRSAIAAEGQACRSGVEAAERVYAAAAQV